jgi:hypothetical protein
MNKVKTFHGGVLSTIQSEVNSFAEYHKIINTSICAEIHGYNAYYTILVLYEE